jgi:chromate transporter
MLLQRPFPTVFRPRGHGAGGAHAQAALLDEREHVPLPSLAHNLKLISVFVLLWLVPVGGLWLWHGGGDVLFREALFFTQAAFITFGGAYAVLSYIADVATNHYGWLTAAQMVHGLGLAESTPGPLIMVTQYVGFLGAWKFHGSYSPLLYGTLGALITTYVTFLPCFLFIFLGAPYIELSGRKQRIQAGLVGVTAAVVGVIMNLAVFFALKVLFPPGRSIDLFALVVAIGSFGLLYRFKLPIHVVVPIGAVVGLLYTLAASR